MKKLTPLFILMILLFSGCSTESLEDQGQITTFDAKAKTQSNDKAQFGIPSLSEGTITETSLEIIITADATTGATGGLSVRWMTKEAYETNGWDNDLGCHAQLQANTNNNYGLAPGGTFTFDLGEWIEKTNCDIPPLGCGQTFYFIVQATQDGGNYSKSEYSTPQAFSTSPCETVCTHGFGYWKNHSNENPGQQVDRWNTDNLDLGSVNYDQDQLNQIMDQNVGGNGLISLAHHLITAKLNILNGVDDSSIAQTIIDADAMIGTSEVPPVGNGSLTTAEVESLKIALETFNNSNPCNDDSTDSEE